MLGPLGRIAFPGGEDRAQSGAFRAGAMLHGDQGGPAARPDGSGRALALYQLSVVDAWRSKGFGMIGDAFFLSDRRSGPAFSPTQASWLLGAVMDRGVYRMEASREEHLPLDHDGVNYHAWRAALLGTWGGAMGEKDPALPYGMGLSRSKEGASFEGDWGVTWYLRNTALPARSDLTGVRHLVYSWRGSYAPPHSGFRLVGSLEAPTAGARWGAAQVDVSAGAGWRQGAAEFLVTHESRDVVDGPGYHAWWQAVFSYAFTPSE